MNITINFSDPTAEETRAAQWWLAQVNAGLPAEEQHANINDYLVDVITNSLLPNWIRREAEARDRETNLRSLWQNATNTQRTAAINALQT